TPVLISVLPELVASHMRGPQIAVSDNAIIVTAANSAGDIFCYSKNIQGNWKPTSRVNDIDTVAKEGLMALGADGNNSFAVWLDLRDKHNKIFGARSADGGVTWSKNIMIYTSPDTTVCECCKPSVIMKGNNVYVMFRNWLNGNRDLYLIQSSDEGNSFSEAQKLGKGSWALNGCPMDGGGLALADNQIVQTVWRRENKIFSCEPGKRETELGEGKSCTIESVAGKNVFAWTENGEVVVLTAKGERINLGKGQLPLLKSADKEHIICIWENEKQIHRAILDL
ncbi:MAG: exo-alpha-sialidase, partial [Bacteroidia bacterium]|nr:exo-alpha-sialidase [Bacteroidia bacterium]